MRSTVARVVLGCVLCLLVAGCGGKGKEKLGAGGTERLDWLDTSLPGDLPLSGDDFSTLPRLDVRFSNVLFAFDSYTVARAEIPKVEQVAAYMRRNPAARLVLGGHCDERGSREYNYSLGENRAQAVRAYLIGLGIPGENIQTRSYGKDRPANPGRNEAAWRENRRAEFALFQKR